MKRCVKCIMPETAKGITFDNEGVCNLCRNYKEFIPKGEEVLKQEIKDFVDENAEFNCVVPVSGGRDSAYVLYYVKKILGLKPIAVHNNNDFETEIVKKNLDLMTKVLDVPLVYVKSPTEISKKVVAEKVKMNSYFGAGLVIAQICEACKYGFEAVAYNVARKNKIKLVFWGDSVYESTADYYEMVKSKPPNKLRRIFSAGMFNFLKYKLYFKKMKKEYGSNKPDGLKEIHLYDYIEWDRKLIVETIKKELGWSVPEKSATTWRVDCYLIPLINYLSEKVYGVSKIEIGFSNMVRSGKMDRTEAIKEIELIKKNMNIEDIEKFFKKIGCEDILIKLSE